MATSKSAVTPAATHIAAVKNPELVNVDTCLTVLSKVNILAESNALAVDIGGSLAKLLYLQPHPSSKSTPPPLKVHLVDDSVATALSVRVPLLSGTLHFFAVETRNIHKLLRFIREHWPHTNPAHRHIRATGGGAYKYAETFSRELDIALTRLDEMKCTVAGLNFLLTAVDNEVYVYDDDSSSPSHTPSPPKPSPTPALPDLTRSRRFVNSTQRPFPYLLVNIGSGVSIVKVTGHDTYERVSGSSLGGGTFWGLSRLLLDCKTFDDVISLTHSGNNENVDMLVGDIYGGAYQSLGLDASVIAASFGKATMRNDYNRSPGTPYSVFALLRHRLRRAISTTISLWSDVAAAMPVLGPILRALNLLPDEDACDGSSSGMVSTADGDQHFNRQDVALSLLRMVSYNIGQIAYLNARVHGLSRIYFGGNFIRDHPYTIADISYAVRFWSGGEMEALFLRHDGYLGAIGAFIGASSAAPTKIIDEEREKSTIQQANPGKEEKEAAKKEQMNASELVSSSQRSLPIADEANNVATVANGTVSGTGQSVATANGVKGIVIQARATSTSATALTQLPNGHSKRRKRAAKTLPIGQGPGGSDAATSESVADDPGIVSGSASTGQAGAKDGGSRDGNDGGWTTVTRIRRRGNGNGNQKV